VAAPSNLDLKAFVPAKDHDLAKQFYLDLGFKLNWAGEQVAEFEAGGFRFLLQKFFVQQHADNFMMHLMVDDADDWWQYIEAAGLTTKYPGIAVKPPAMQPWGLRVLYLTDPSGVLWHIADRGAGQRSHRPAQNRRYVRPHESRSETFGDPVKYQNLSLIQAQFTDVDLSSSSFDDVNLSNASFTNIALAGASFSDVNLRNASITDAAMDGMRINGILVTDLFAAHERCNNG